MDFESASSPLKSPLLPAKQAPLIRRPPRAGQHLCAALSYGQSIAAYIAAGGGGDDVPPLSSSTDEATPRASSSISSSSSSSSSSRFEKRGVTIKLIRAVRDYVKSAEIDADEVDKGAWLKCEVPGQCMLFLPMKTKDGRALFTAIADELEPWSIGRVCALVVGNREILKVPCRWGDYIDPNSTLTYSDRCSLIDLLERKHPNVRRKHPQLGVSYKEVVGSKANVFISFAYCDNFFELVESLELFVCKHPELVEEATYFWLDLFVNDQWNALDRPFDWWATTFREAVGEIGNTVYFLSPWSDPSIFKRAWCLLEISYSKKLSLLLNEKQLKSFQDILRSEGPSVITASLCKIDMKNATSSLKEDKDKIFAVVEQMEGGFHRFNVKVMSLIREWVASSAKSMLDGITIKTGGGVRDCNDYECEYNTNLSKGRLVNMSPGLLLGDKSNLDWGKALHQRPLGGKEKALGREHPPSTSIVSNLGVSHSDKSDIEGAKALFQRAFEGIGNALGSEHPTTIDRVDNRDATIDKVDNIGVLYEQSYLDCLL